MADDGTYAEWIKSNPPPDLQELVRRAGERRAAQLGEVYDIKNPAHGGYPPITAQEWEAYDRDKAGWQLRRRERYQRR
jgi:hypothetical protein